jgi:outer membrane receptor protein involved in Fe transport
LDYHLKLEAYYQSLFDVPVLNDSTSAVSSINFNSGFTSEDFVSEGTGDNYGLELTIEKFFSRNFYFMATGSLFESKYTALDQIVRNTRFNSNYIFNLLGGKEFQVGKQRQHIIGTNFRIIWRGGYRITPIDLAASIEEERTVLDESRIFEDKVPDYVRLDIGFSYRKNKPKYSWILSADIQNLTNRLNIYGIYYDTDRMEIRESTMVGLIPVLNYRIEF